MIAAVRRIAALVLALGLFAVVAALLPGCGADRILQLDDLDHPGGWAPGHRHEIRPSKPGISGGCSEHHLQCGRGGLRQPARDPPV